MEQARRDADEMAREQHAWHLEQHERSPVDHSWAKASSQILSEDLATLVEATDGASLEQVDCRTDSCIARLRFGSLERARDKAPDLVSHVYELNCATAIQLEEADPSAPYELELVLYGCVGKDT